MQEFHLPFPKKIYAIIYAVITTLSALFWTFVRVFWLEPLFPSQCTKCGKHLRMSASLPYILGSGTIEIGERCRINGKINIYFSNRYYDWPTLRAGNNCSLGHLLNINIAQEVCIGDNVRIGGYVFISDSDGHPKNKIARRNQPIEKESIRPGKRRMDWKEYHQQMKIYDEVLKVTRVSG